MKTAATRWIDQIGRRTGDRFQGLHFARFIGARHTVEQANRIGMARRTKELDGLGQLDDLAGIHHRHAPAILGHHPHIMGDQDQAQMEFLL